MAKRKRRTNQKLHYRVWQGGYRAVSACRRTTEATTTPDAEAVNCAECRSHIKAPA